VENKALVSFTTNEAAILDSIEKSKVIPSKNEAWRRGIEAVSLLLETSESALFDLLSSVLYSAASEVNNQERLLHHLAQGRAVADAVQATLISKKGLPGAEFMDAFTATLRDLSLLSDPESYREADMKELESTLFGMAQLASRYASPSAPPSPTPSLVSRSKKVPH
jgi:hypothetical protein